MPVEPAHLLKRLRRLAVPPGPTSASDVVLLGRFVRHRDEDAFAALVARYGPMVLRVCRRLLGDPHDTEDAFQATFLVLARRAGAIRPPAALAAWLHEVARRVALKARATRVRQRQREQAALVREPLDPHPDPLAELSARDLLTVLDEEVRRLPEAYRLPVLLCCVEGRSQEEAARQLGWTPGSVRGRLERGRRRLHARLLRRGLTLSAGLLALEVSRGVTTARVPARLVEPVVRAARSLALPSGAAAGGVSARASALAEGVVRTMMLTKLKTLTLLVLLAGAVAVGSVLTHRALAGCATSPAAEGGPVAQAEADPEPMPASPGADAWSAPNVGLSARLRVEPVGGPEAARHEAAVEFKNVAGAKPIDVSNRFRIEARLIDVAGQDVTPHDQAAGSATVVPRHWVQVPRGAYVGFPADLRALGVELTPKGAPREKGTSLLAIGEHEWSLRPGRYTIRARLTLDKVEENSLDTGRLGRGDQVVGRIDLPPAELIVGAGRLGNLTVPPAPARSRPVALPSAALLLTMNAFDLEAGVEQQLDYPVGVRREGCEGPVTLHVSGLPKGVRVPDVTIPADKDRATLRVYVSQAVAEVRTTAIVTASAEGATTQMEVGVSVRRAGSPEPADPVHGRIELSLPDRVDLEPSGTCLLRVGFRSYGFAAPVSVRAEGLPDGVRCTQVGVHEDEPARVGNVGRGSAQLVLGAAASAPVGDHEITVRASASGGAIQVKGTVRVRIARRPAAAPPGAGRHDLDVLQGRWAVVAVNQDGSSLSKQLLEKFDLELLVEGDRFSWLRAGVPTGPSSGGTLCLDEAATPKTIDLFHRRQEAKAEPKIVTSLGIYNLEGQDTLRLALGQSGRRPTDFAPGRGKEVFLLKRSKP
jgi:RNA polymerase sigma factor (sigma-70 family)